MGDADLLVQGTLELEEKFNRAESAGLGALLAGLTLMHEEDADRIVHGGQLFEPMLRYFANRSDE